MDTQKETGCERTCKTCEYFDYRGVKIARETNYITGYVCAVKGHGTSSDKCACDCYLQEGQQMTKQEKIEELRRIAVCSQGVLVRKPRSKTLQRLIAQNQESN
jgi:hypothetical protein